MISVCVVVGVFAVKKKKRWVNSTAAAASGRRAWATRTKEDRPIFAHVGFLPGGLEPVSFAESCGPHLSGG